jgi:hypothetical protein
MKSNSLPQAFEEMSNEQKLEGSKFLVNTGIDTVGKAIDELTSSSLKRVLKVVSHIHFAEALVEKNGDYNLNEKEQNLIDKIFALQETVFGHQALVKEISENDNNSTDMTTDLTTSLEENNNE